MNFAGVLKILSSDLYVLVQIIAYKMLLFGVFLVRIFPHLD